MNSYSCIEWRGEHKGMHLHMEIEYKYRNMRKMKRLKSPGEIKDKCYNSCKNMVGNKLGCNCRYNVGRGFRNYVNGYKKGEPKGTYDVTIMMRKENKMSNILEEDWPGEN